MSTSSYLTKWNTDCWINGMILIGLISGILGLGFNMDVPIVWRLPYANITDLYMTSKIKIYFLSCIYFKQAYRPWSHRINLPKKFQGVRVIKNVISMFLVGHHVTSDRMDHRIGLVIDTLYLLESWVSCDLPTGMSRKFVPGRQTSRNFDWLCVPRMDAFSLTSWFVAIDCRNFCVTKNCGTQPD